MQRRTVFAGLAIALCVSVALGTLDVAVEIVSPTGSQAPGLVSVVVLLTNVGDEAANVPRVDVTIAPSGYQDYRENVAVDVGRSQPVSMNSWNYAGGVENCMAYITYPDDVNHSNDTAVVVVGGGGVSDRAERELGAGMGLTLSPSPLAGNVVHVEYSLNQAGPASVVLFDVRGRVALRRDFDGSRRGDLPLNLTGLSGGVYIVRLTDGRSSVTQKLVVQR
ncbi:T9SS type A sorting domain-containing protein [candidate division WOR-3 bacterium]|nr:T9SS type A sorting domain-containing protein [candidate division WOR-3 bacterium]